MKVGLNPPNFSTSIQMAYTITPGSPSENGYIESFNARLRDERLDSEIFYTLTGGTDRHRGAKNFRQLSD